jgi:CspA family cold shock protein
MEHSSGTVKWFSQEKGFGFVTREDGTDIFVHHSGISGRGFKTLEQGERVEFDILEEPKGLKAQNLVRLDAPAEGNGMGRGQMDDDSFGNRAGAGETGYGSRAGGYGGGHRGGRDAGYGSSEW